MGLAKAELKKALLHGLGCEADDRVEALRTERHRAEGAAASFPIVRRKIETDVFARLRRDVDEDKVTADAAKAADRYLKTCCHLLQHLEKQASEQLPIMAGRILEAERRVKELKALVDDEDKKIEALKGAAELPPEDEARRRPAGARPGPTLKQQRTKPIHKKKATKKKATKKRASKKKAPPKVEAPPKADDGTNARPS